MTTGTMALDQYGGAYYNLDPHPRKELLKRFGTSHADKMYIERRDGTNPHIGYIIAGYWLTLYNVTPWEGRR